MTYHEQWGEPAAGLALAREGLEIGRRRGSRLYGSWMVGNGCVCALRTGDWDWAAGLLDEWLALESAAIRVGRVLRGPRDPALAPGRGRDGGPRGGGPDPGRGREHRPAVSETYGLWAGAWAAFAAGRPDEVRRLGEHAVELMEISCPARRPAPRPQRAVGRRRPGSRLGPGHARCVGVLGAALAADRLVAQAGIDALQGRGPAALAGYREALRAYRKLGLAFDEAAAAVDMAVLLRSPERDAPDVATAIAAARDTLERLGARPFLARLDEARTLATGRLSDPRPAVIRASQCRWAG